MGWRDREYAQTWEGESGRVVRGVHLPPRGTLALVVLHVLAFLIVWGLPSDEGLDVSALLAVSGPAPHPLAILAHPVATTRLGTLALVVFAGWTLGARLESRFGTARLLALYVCGNLLAGAVCFAVARWQPDLAAAALSFPAGALVAWCLAAWRGLADEFFSLFGRLLTVAKTAALAAVIAAGVVLLLNGRGASALLAGAAIGGVAEPLVEGLAALRRRRARRRSPTPTEHRPTRPATRPAQPPPDEPDIDDILAKISRQGLDSLTQAERDRLETASRAKQRRRS